MRGWREHRRDADAPAGRCCRDGAKYRSIANTVMPIEPNGTRPISTLCPDSRSHSSEPTPMPIENSASSSVYDMLGSPPSTSFVKFGSCVRKIEP